MLLAANIYAEHSGLFIVDLHIKAGFAAAFLLLWTLTCMPFGASCNSKRHRIWLWGLFIYYLWVLSNLLFFDAVFGRDVARAGLNMEPLYTIRNYLRAYRNGNIRGLVILNLFGNLAAFAPMAVFLPALFRRQRNLLVFTFTIAVMVCAVEGIQLYTGTGSCDIDDLILNTAGAVAVWLFLLPWRWLIKERDR